MARPVARPPGGGHSLLEALLVLAVLAILLSLAAPPIVRWDRRFAAAAAARALRGDLARARTDAVLRGESVSVGLDTLAGAWRTTTQAGDTLRVRVLGPGLALSTTAHRQRILFTARGTSDLYSTTWIRVPADPGAREHGLRVAPTGAIERR